MGRGPDQGRRQLAAPPAAHGARVLDGRDERHGHDGAYAATFKHLQKLNLEDNFFAEADIALLKKVLANAEFGEQKDDEDPEFLYTSIAE
ncbi:MAG: hypothetical protein ACOZQL_05035 [Myxococcota bacterium]